MIIAVRIAFVLLAGGGALVEWAICRPRRQETGAYAADGLLILGFNVGMGAFEKSTLFARLKAGDFAGAVSQFGRWAHGGGKVLPGLIKRRAAERALFLEQP